MLPIRLCYKCGDPIPEDDYICSECANKEKPPYYKCKYFNENSFTCNLTGDDCLSNCQQSEEVISE